MMLPTAEIASNVPDAVLVFGEGPNTYVDGLSWGWKTLSVGADLREEQGQDVR